MTRVRRSSVKVLWVYSEHIPELIYPRHYRNQLPVYQRQENKDEVLLYHFHLRFTVVPFRDHLGHATAQLISTTTALFIHVATGEYLKLAPRQNYSLSSVSPLGA